MNIQLTYEPRSILYNLEPRGLGTLMIESLTSYLTRIAAEHNNTVGQLVNKLIIPNLDKDYLYLSSNYGGNRFYEGAKTLNGFMENASSVVKAMEFLTSRCDIEKLTLLNMKDCIPLRGLLKKSLSWCPYCIKGWIENNESIYYPLIWYVGPIEICQIHSCYLTNTCHACNSTQDILRRQSILGFCQNCSQILNDCSESKLCEDDSLDWHNYLIRSIGTLLNFEQKALSSVKSMLVENLNVVNEVVFEGNSRKFGKTLNFSKSTVCGWLKGEVTPTLINQIYISYRLNLELENLLFGFEDYKNMGITEKISVKYSTLTSSRNLLDEDIVEKKFKEIIQNIEPISMAEAAEKIGVNKRTLYRNHRDYCVLISNNYKQYLEERKKKRIDTLKKEVEHAFISLHKEGIYPSRRKMEGYLGKPGVLKEREVQLHWKELLFEIDVINGEVN
jgi:hypothetical protein